MSFEQLFIALKNGITLLTVNQRQSRDLQQRYARHFTAPTENTLAEPNIFPYQIWLQRLWEQELFSHDPPREHLLNENQKRFLFQQVLTAANQASGDMSTTFTLKNSLNTLIEAWNITKQYEINLETIPVETPETAAFIEVAHRYEELCRGKNVFDPVLLAAKLATRYTQKKPLLLNANEFRNKECAQKSTFCVSPDSILIYGFDEISPLQARLFQQCREQGIQIEGVEMHGPRAQPPTSTTEFAKKLPTSEHTPLPSRHCYEFQNPEEEIRAAASAAMQCLAEHPENTFAIVVPNLTQVRAKVERLCTEVSAPEQLFNYRYPHAVPFNISLGIPLNHYPLIQTALQLLQLSPGENSLTLISQLLASPFLAGGLSESYTRANLNLSLLALANDSVHLSTVLRLASSSSAKQNAVPNCPLFALALTQFLQQSAQSKILTTQTKTLRAWIQTWQHRLIHFGWPGERSLNSAEQQTLWRWQEALNTCADLDQLDVPVNYATAVNLLEEQLALTLFQPQTLPKRWQILGVLECIGLQFTDVWLLNADDDTWPTLHTANPFLPKVIQRQYQVPHATIEYATMVAKRQLQHLQHSAVRRFMASYHQQEGALEKQLSALLTIPLEPFPLPQTLSVAEQHFHQQCIEEFQDDYFLPVEENELANLAHAGTGLLKAQAACPFQAFAHWRLRAESPASACFGLDASERGTLIHLVLEKIWKKLGNHATLLSYTPTALQQELSTIIQATLPTINAWRDYALPKALMELEVQRLTKLLQEWLSLTEAARAPFSVIATEEKHVITLDKLRLNIKLDRVDQLNDGSMVIIDYKTGLHYPTADKWLDPRPDEPQLALYALLPWPQLAGIVLAQLPASNQHFSGLHDDPAQFGPDQPVKSWENLSDEGPQNWTEFQTQISEHLTTLARDFLQGEHHVAPKKPLTCQQCDLQALCRIHELAHD